MLVVTAAKTLVFCILGAFATGPLVGYVKSRRIFGESAKQRFWVLPAYYVPTLAVAVLVAALITDVDLGAHSLLVHSILDHVALIGIIMLPLLGPWIGCGIVGAAAAAAGSLCAGCGYNLTGNVSGVCPECGRASAAAKAPNAGLRARWRLAPWRRVARIWLVGSCLLFILSGVQLYTWGRYCPECARSEYYDSYRIVVPFSYHTTLLKFPEVRRSPSSVNRKELIDFLDSAGTCTHNWMGLSVSTEGVTGSTRGLSYNPASLTTEEEFEACSKDHPEMIDRIRADLRQRRNPNLTILQVHSRWIAEQRNR